MSSNLILPQHHVNQTLENNLKALFARYPHERARLEEVLRKPAPVAALKNVTLPPTPSKPPIRILLLCGIVNPIVLADLINDRTVQQENYKLFIFEQNPEFLAYCFQKADLTQVINYPKTEWFLLHTAESVKSALFRAMKPEQVTSMFLNVQVLNLTEDEMKEESAVFYNQLPDLYHETAGHVLHNHGNLDDSLIGIEVTLRNKDFVINCPGILDLKNHYRGRTALIVGAGPSLEKVLPTIKKYNDRFVIIAADAALKPLMCAGVRVDYVTSIERLNSYQKPFFENLEKVDADLVAFPVVHPEVLKLYPGTVRIVYRNYSFFAYFEKAYPKGLLRCGGSTSHLGIRLAEYMGCRTACLIGIDSSYQEKDGLYRSHCPGTGHPEWGEFVSLQEHNLKRGHQPAIEGINNRGEKVMTNITYYQWIKEYSEELAYIGQTMNIKNCSPTGLKIDGVPFVDLETIAEKLDPNLTEKPAKCDVPFNRAWSNKELVKNFRGWKDLCADSIEESDALLTMETIDLDRYQALLYACQFRLLVDDMFIAFVVQCCAYKFFEIENRWWSLALQGDQDLKEKTQVLKDRFQLFHVTLDRLVKMIEEERESNGE